MADRKSYMRKPRSSKRAEFVKDAIQYQGSGCLLFPFAKASDGYGPYLTLNGRRGRPHQFVCEATHGPKPSAAYEVAHTCRQASCCNPTHLRWDTRKGNVLDCVGEARKFAKLTPAKVLAIRSATDRTQLDLAREFGVSKWTVWAILHRKKWGWLP